MIIKLAASINHGRWRALAKLTHTLGDDFPGKTAFKVHDLIQDARRIKDSSMVKKIFHNADLSSKKQFDYVSKKDNVWKSTASKFGKGQLVTDIQSGNYSPLKHKK